jgi:hypothetical protein
MRHHSSQKAVESEIAYDLKPFLTPHRRALTSSSQPEDLATLVKGQVTLDQSLSSLFEAPTRNSNFTYLFAAGGKRLLQEKCFADWNMSGVQYQAQQAAVRSYIDAQARSFQVK